MSVLADTQRSVLLQREQSWDGCGWGWGFSVGFPSAEEAAVIQKATIRDPYRRIPADLDLCPLTFPLKRAS